MWRTYTGGLGSDLGVRYGWTLAIGAGMRDDGEVSRGREVRIVINRRCCKSFCELTVSEAKNFVPLQFQILYTYA